MTPTSCEHRWLPIRSKLWFKVVCLRCDERRRVAPRWIRGIHTHADAMRLAEQRGVT